nr:protein DETOXIFICATION 44, chloroplastic isoform X1 [Tanacetum cinerariifolium]
MIFCGCFIDFTIIDAYSPTRDGYCWDKFIIFVGDNCDTAFLWYTVDWTDPRTIGNWIKNTATSHPVNAIAFVLDGLYYGLSDFGYASYCMVVIGLVTSAFFLFAVPKFESLDDTITWRKDGSSRNTYYKLSDSDSEFSSSAIAMNSLKSEIISSSRRVPSMEWRILLPFGVKKRSSQDERNFAIFFHFETNEISRKGLRVSRDSFAYNKYGIRLMLAPRLAKALHEKVLLKLHGIRKLPGSSSFGGTLLWIIAELSSLRKAAKFC